MLTQIELKKLLNYDEKTGIFTRLIARNQFKIGEIAGGLDVSTGYIRLRIAGKSYRAHRLAWLYTHGSWPIKYIDHINGDKTDNSILNLRDVTPSGNRQNQRVASKTNKTTGLIGISVYSIGRYRAQISVYGKNKHLGLFDTPEEAHQAYLNAKRVLHATCTI
jgi:hypothetical protein